MKAVQRWLANRSLSRRALLRSLGASAALSPFLPLLEAQGQEAQPLRLILWFTPHGTVYDNWKPSGGQTDFTLSPILKPLEAYRGKLNILDGLKIQADGVGAPHTKGPPLLWTASPLNNTADASIGTPSSLVRHLPMPSKFSSARPMGSIRA